MMRDESLRLISWLESGELCAIIHDTEGTLRWVSGHPFTQISNISANVCKKNRNCLNFEIRSREDLLHENKTKAKNGSVILRHYREVYTTKRTIWSPERNLMLLFLCWDNTFLKVHMHEIFIVRF
jgi:hypothetical protein